MVSTVLNPALEQFAALIAPELIVGQVLIRRTAEGFALSHVADRDASSLRVLSVEQLRALADFTEQKQYRPLKSAPTLPRGWSCAASNLAELDAALRHLYPGAMADWFAAQQQVPPATHYREFTARQTGMYRTTTMLNDAQVAQVARAGCHVRFCLKRRLWTVEGLPADAVSEKSLIPCLEPCAVLLEFARASARLEQREKQSMPLTEAEIAALSAALQTALQSSAADSREGDFSAPDNARRWQWLLEKLKSLSEKKDKNEHD